MKIRLMGTESECEAGAELLPQVFTVLEVSGWYPNRGVSVLGRLYVDVEVAR